jgi:hypothetical protein
MTNQSEGAHYGNGIRSSAAHRQAIGSAWISLLAVSNIVAAYERRPRIALLASAPF